MKHVQTKDISLLETYCCARVVKRPLRSNSVAQMSRGHATTEFIATTLLQVLYRFVCGVWGDCWRFLLFVLFVSFCAICYVLCSSCCTCRLRRLCQNNPYWFASFYFRVSPRMRPEVRCEGFHSSGGSFEQKKSRSFCAGTVIYVPVRCELCFKITLSVGLISIPLRDPKTEKITENK